ncbi:Ribosome biogenesis protein BOP1-like [Citrus sinensis]|uniref:Ribosome biogenesis protein BOP1-like n=1 Tax=Citrus sinensis TaxID=2711 RepID=A0ACB8K9Q7_CITSI|nr:Ribosome biogenesis protein BOP1-like [Citrus sinensis]
MRERKKSSAVEVSSVKKKKEKKTKDNNEPREQKEKEESQSIMKQQKNTTSRSKKEKQRKATEDYQSLRESELSGDEVHGTDHDVDNADDHHEEDQTDGSEGHRGVEESDSSEDEVAPRNTIGDVPLEWYKDEKHIGYDISGKKITKKERQDKLASFLANVDDSKSWRKIYDEYNDEEVELTKEEIRLVQRLLKGKAPHTDFDQYADYVDWFKYDDALHPLSNAPEPKRRFIPSKWESKKVVQYVRAIRKGLIKFDEPKEEEPKFYLLWGDDSSAAEKANHLAYIPAPKPKLPGHEESYNPSLEYIPTQEELNSYQLMYEEDRPKFIPRRFTSLRSVPAYENAVKDSFERCMDLYLCPRVRKKRVNIDPETLKPKLPSRKDLKPYPVACYLEYKGHKGAVVSISTEASGQWFASGSTDGTVRIWEVESGRCLRVLEIGEAIQYVAWNPLPELPVLAVSAGQDVLILNTGLGNEEEQRRVKDLLHVETPTAPDVLDLGLVEDHLLKNLLLALMFTLDGVFGRMASQGRLPLHVFHPTRSIFFVSTKKNIRVYDLLKQRLIKKLETGLKEVSSIAIHPAGDNLIVGSREGKLCWFDMDLSSKPYRVLKCHPKDITNVAFHRSYPLFASCSDDCTAYVFHGMVYSDLNQNPLIVPLEILRGHTSSNGRGVMDCKFHPRQPWLFTAGADSVIRLYCH